MFNFFTSRKIEKSALNIHREMWEKGLSVRLTLEDRYNNIVRLNCGRFQLHIKSNILADRCRWRNVEDTETLLLRTFAVALACSNFGKPFSQFSHMVNGLTLDGTNENIL